VGEYDLQVAGLHKVVVSPRRLIVAVGTYGETLFTDWESPIMLKPSRGKELTVNVDDETDAFTITETDIEDA